MMELAIPKATQSRVLIRLCIAAVLLPAGCKRKSDLPAKDDATAQNSSSSAPSARESKRSFTFADRTWVFAGPCFSTGDICRPSMSATCYTTDVSNLRLIELVPDESSSLPEGVFARIRRVQINKNGRWMSHGFCAEWFLNGGRSESHYVLGQIHGTQREWYANGQLHIERGWANGERNGRDRGWYENGQPMYDVVNLNGEELHGKAWREDGTLIE